MITELTCIGCPMGCQITAESENGKILSVSGQSCAIGKRYAEEELTHPTRMVTSLMETVGSGTPLSVKTSKPIGKEKIFECLAEIRRTKAQLPVHIGDILIRNVCGTDTDIV
ncbi:MAG: DUF1667 domain-containing protein, partial [Cloacibacillus porcorum]|nr:DUF1667 domain-containing protein [Cloacibacillus porcorum]